MAVSRTLLCFVYGAIALLALFATWHQNIAYFGTGNPLAGTFQFWKETLVTPASVSIMVDIFLLGLAVVAWMVVEARRLGIRFVWVYVVLGALVAISVTVPLFLIARERRLSALEGTGEVVDLGQGDLVGLGLFALPALVLSLWSLLR
jgi:hypothetical protein